MRKLIFAALAGAAIALAAPEFAAATPLPIDSGLATAAEGVGTLEQARWRRYRVHRYRVYRVYRHRHRCWHRRHWSGRRCW
jgi:hypothetical protein